ncbi:MAG: hypothetical protein PHN64_09390 [Desulfovibrionaceae bacterium]|nr:hypothetical protein [Desulfovibrionaceae bacterium]
MPIVQHSGLTGVDAIHVPYAYVYADSAAREAATNVSAADVGKLFRQLDDNSLWMLVGVSPLAWKEVGSMPDLASTEKAGLVQRATDAEASAGTDTEKYVSPKQILDVIAANTGDSEQIIIKTSQTWTAPRTGFLYITLVSGGGGGGRGYGNGYNGNPGGNGGDTTAFNERAVGGGGGGAAYSGSPGGGGSGDVNGGSGGYTGGNGATFVSNITESPVSTATGGASGYGYGAAGGSAGVGLAAGGGGGGGGSSSSSGKGGGGGGSGRLVNKIVKVEKGVDYSIVIGGGGAGGIDYGGASSGGGGGRGASGICIFIYI